MSRVKNKTSITSQALDRKWNKQLIHLRSTEIGGSDSSNDVIIDNNTRQIRLRSSSNERIQKSRLLYTQARSKERNLHRLEAKINKHEKNPFIKKAYTQRISAELAFVKVLKAKTAQRTASEDKDRQIHAALSALYPIPSHEEMEKYIGEFISFIQYIKTHNELGIDTFEEIDSILTTKFYGFNGIIPEIAFENEVAKYKKQVTSEKEGRDFNAAEVKAICKKVLMHYGIARESRVTIKNKSLFSVNPSKRLLSIPQSTSIKKVRLTQIIFHEIGVHLYRAILGRQNSNEKKQRLRILQSGNQSNIAIEEGIATYFEQNCFYDSSKYDIPATFVFYQRLIAVQLALHFEPYEVYEKLMVLEKLRGVLFAVPESTQRKNVRNTLMRIYRGFITPRKGYVNAKVAQYLIGNRMIWEFIESGGKVHNLFVGKVNIEDIEPLRTMGFTIPEEYLGSKNFPRDEIMNIIEKSI